MRFTSVLAFAILAAGSLATSTTAPASAMTTTVLETQVVTVTPTVILAARQDGQWTPDAGQWSAPVWTPEAQSSWVPTPSSGNTWAAPSYTAIASAAPSASPAAQPEKYRATDTKEGWAIASAIGGSLVGVGFLGLIASIILRVKTGHWPACCYCCGGRRCAAKGYGDIEASQPSAPEMVARHPAAPGGYYHPRQPSGTPAHPPRTPQPNKRIFHAY